MTDRLAVDGQLVATAHVGQRHQRDTVMLFRAPAGMSSRFPGPGSPASWTTLVISRYERWDDDAEAVVSAGAGVTVGRYGSLQEVRDALEREWFDALLDAGHGEDRDLHRMWAPAQLIRDLDKASIYNQDLAQASGYLGGPTPAPGRALSGWQDEALLAMALHLEEDAGCWDSPFNKIVWREPALTIRSVPEGTCAVCGELLTDPERALSSCDHSDTRAPGDDDILGFLRIWDAKLGLEAVLIVRVDYCGEIFARVAERHQVDLTAVWTPAQIAHDLGGDLSGYAMRALNEEEMEHAGDLLEHRSPPPREPGQ